VKKIKSEELLDSSDTLEECKHMRRVQMTEIVKKESVELTKIQLGRTAL